MIDAIDGGLFILFSPLTTHETNLMMPVKWVEIISVWLDPSPDNQTNSHVIQSDIP